MYKCLDDICKIQYDSLSKKHNQNAKNLQNVWFLYSSFSSSLFQFHIER